MVQPYWWQSAGLYRCGAYDEQTGRMRAIGAFADRGIAIACAARMKRVARIAMCAGFRHWWIDVAIDIRQTTHATSQDLRHDQLVELSPMRFLYSVSPGSASLGEFVGEHRT
jgi:hypothetical protein